MKILSWNILSNLATKFTFAGQRLEKPEEYQKRYSLVISEIFDQLQSHPQPILISLQEVTEDFIKLLKQEIEKSHPPYQLYYPKLTFQQACLVHNSFRVKPLNHNLIDQFPRSKVQILGCSLNSASDSFGSNIPSKFVITNLHLSGDPHRDGINERRECIKGIINLLKEKKVFDYCPIIMVGDFNEDANTLFNDTDLQTLFSNNDLEPYRKNTKVTSYHAYEFHFDEKQRKLICDGESTRAEQSIDQLVYSNQLMLKHVLTRPKNGLKGLQVPYTHKIVGKEFVHYQNYQIWPSDHALMIYEFL